MPIIPAASEPWHMAQFAANTRFPASTSPG